MKREFNSRLSKEYIDHAVFQQLDEYIDYYDSLAYHVILWTGTGTKSPLNFNSYIFSSIKATLRSIKTTLEQGQLNDAYSMTRGFRDAVVTNIFQLVEIDKHRDMGNWITEKVNNWLYGKEKLPQYHQMIDRIVAYEKLKTINELLLPNEGFYKELSTRLNDHTHYNSFQYMLWNDGEIHDRHKVRLKLLNQLEEDIRQIFIKHFVWLFAINEHYMMSSDYTDYLEVGQIPPENSEFWVATFVQEAFDAVIKVHRPDLAIALKQSVNMELV